MRKFAYVGDRLSTEGIVNSCEWACFTLVVGFNSVILITTTNCNGTATDVKMIKLPNLPKPTI